jgi:hypothetical protein
VSSPLSLALLLACRPATPEDSAPVEASGPWEDLEPTQLELRWLKSTPIDQAIDPQQVEIAQEFPFAFVLDEDRVHTLDGRWHHSAEPHCIETEAWGDFETEGRQGRCAEGSVELRRGVLEPQAAPIGVAVDSERVWVMDEAGRLYAAPLDPLAVSPWDHLRLELVDTLPRGALGTSAAGELWVATQDLLLDAQGAEIASLPAPALSISRGVVLTDLGPWTLEQGLSPIETLGLDGGLLCTPEGLLDLDTREETELDCLGPVARDGDRVYALVAEGLWADGEVLELDPPRDLAVRDGELALLYADRVEVYLDDRAVGEGLQVFTTTFAEKPKSPGEDAECPEVLGFVDTALANRALLDDLPGQVAVGITPHLARRADACGADLPAAVCLDHGELGVLFHQDPDCPAGDQDCVAAFFLEETEIVRRVLDEPSWISGLSSVKDLGHDWAEAALRVDIPHRMLFFGISILPDIEHSTDPRSKDAYPIRLGTQTLPWSVSDASFEQAGDLDIFPGDNVPAFSHSGCANLFLRECQTLGAGDGQSLDAEDIAVLQVLLHRALVVGEGTWSYHLPDIGSWDYTLGCSVEDRIWSDCEGALLQGWLMDVHARYVLNGKATWAAPSELTTP